MLTKLLFLFSIFCYVTADSSEEKQGEECKPLALSLKPIVDAINVTDRFFRPPEEYKAYADTCEAIINCAKKVDESKLPKLMEKLSPCLFYMYYNREFSTCAKKLIAKKDDNIPCLNTLFNDVHEPDVDQCEQWDGLQPCVKEQIAKFCDDKDGKIQKEYTKQILNLRVELCED